MTSLSPLPPYSFALFCDILARYPQPSLFGLIDGAYVRTLRTGDSCSLVRVTATGTPQKPILHIDPLAGDINSADLTHHITNVLGVDSNINDFYAFAQSEETLWRIVEPLYGLPLYRAESVYQALVFVIIEQHIAWATAQRAQRVLVEWAGNRIEHNGQSYYAMPSPEQLANATIDDLKPLKITFKRMQLLIDLSRQVADGSLDLDGLLDASPQTMYEALLKIKGIGHWTASVVVSRARGIYPYVAHNDVALQAAVREYFHVEKSAQAVTETFAPYGDYAGLAAHFTLMRWVLDKYPVVVGNE